MDGLTLSWQSSCEMLRTFLGTRHVTVLYVSLGLHLASKCNVSTAMVLVCRQGALPWVHGE